MLILPVCVACKKAPATDICLGHLCNASRCLACVPHCFRTCHCGEGPYCPRCSCTCESLIVSTPVTSQVGRTSAVVRSPPREGGTPVHVMEDRWRRWSSYLLGKWRSDAESEAYNVSRCHRHQWPRGPGQGTTSEMRFAAAWVRTGRTERAQLSWRYFVKHVRRDRAAIRKERARQAALA